MQFLKTVAVTTVLISSIFVCPICLVQADEWSDKDVDVAIENALEYLSKRQLPNGAWQIDNIGESTASTSLAVMAFLAGGHVPGEGPYGDQIDKGIRWVLDHQEANGMLIHKTSHGPMYSHGISTLMLAEVVGMLGVEDAARARRALERAIRLILEAQAVPKSERQRGGWRYQPSSRDSDLSVTGWQLLALRAAKDIGCDVPAESIDLAVEYVKMCATRDQKGFGYQPGGGPTATRTGTGILCMEVCGVHESPEAVGGAEYIIKDPLDYRDSYFFYGVYYCSVGMFKIGGKYWEQTRRDLFSLLLEKQDADGSWSSENASERRVGQVYSTSLSVLALAIEYRYLPIYQR
ncbi:prenyltransferase/squalene oxidase repeat-containing protein [Rubinisphaera italica]|uniref:Prenyltransferase and squalene oxidase repeat protein n=1 Tax=Rubinisphaera italica TaxID=2527969 RepID=A0A5C5XBR3_9PLAN|nr:prenyltransferase/squalene oxidase repeat-containing protein [Rubinisphaera italica]TWT60079.1 Prenyltransferase and squalene oxidase repeat protein [Rubinisphaera italica]